MHELARPGQSVKRANQQGLNKVGLSERKNVISVRIANPNTDVETAADVVRRSIVQLCVDDHRNDAATLAIWLANKTADHFSHWISNVDNFFVVAEKNALIAGVGLLHRGGEIKLFYVAPDAQRQGVGRAIHAALEEKAEAWGLRQLTLESSYLARPFYEVLGYQSAGAAKARFGVLSAYPYKKTLKRI